MPGEIKYPQVGEATARWKEWWNAQAGVPYSTDVDSIAYRFAGDMPVPVAVLEVTSSVMLKPDDRVLGPIWDRVSADNARTKLLLQVAGTLGVPLFVIVHGDGMKHFALRCLTNDSGKWHRVGESKMVAWLARLGQARPDVPSVAAVEVEVSPEENISYWPDTATEG